MMKTLKHAVCGLLLLAASIPAPALVNPETTTLPVQSWMVDILVVGEDEALNFFCRGVLIDKRWVLTAARCLFDPFKSLEEAADETDPDFVVVPDGSGEIIKVLEFVQSDDFTLGMMFLEEAVAAVPVKLSTRTEASLLNTDVQIWGRERTQAITDSFYNPDPLNGTRMNCGLDGMVFSTGSATSGGAFCYLSSKPVAGSSLFTTRARVIDPAAAGSPNAYLDTYGGFDRSGARLYLDFRTSGSYPCLEDLGAPIVLPGANGSVELVGIVAGVGMAASLPICGTFLINRFANVAHNLAFIEQTMIEQAFASLCPPQPELHVDYPGGDIAHLYWDQLPGATGYKLHYTSWLGHAKLQTGVVGNVAEYSAKLAPGVYYAVTLSAYNDTCSSELSEPRTVGIDP